jgi:hypothetical protein
LSADANAGAMVWNKTFTSSTFPLSSWAHFVVFLLRHVAAAHDAIRPYTARRVVILLALILSLMSKLQFYTLRRHRAPD